MRLTSIFVLSLVGFIPFSLNAQTAENSTAKVSENPYAKLRGISYFYIDVLTTENRIDDTEIRQDIRDTIELELRRSGITPKELSQLSPSDNSVPLQR